MDEEESKDKCHWVEAERLTAVKLIHKRYAELYSKFKGASLGGKKKDAIWQSIAEKHNSSGVAQNVRTVENLKIMYKNVKSRARAKNAQRKKTGGGPKPRISLAEEEVLIQLRDKPQLEGIDGAVETTGSTKEADIIPNANGANGGILERADENEEGESSDEQDTDFDVEQISKENESNDQNDRVPAPEKVVPEKLTHRTAASAKRKRGVPDQLYLLEVKRAELEIKTYEQNLRHKQEMFILEKESLLQRKHQDSILFKIKKELLEANLKHAVENQLFTFEP